jgi:hypothetical protein
MRSLFAPISFIALLCAGSGSATGRAADPVPLHARVDALLERGQPGGQAALAGDAEFLRRTWLALHGTIPSAAQARAFLADQAPAKRARLVDALLADRQFARWMAVRLDVMLMERRGETHTKAAPWRDWLEESIAANRPWNELVRDILANDGSDEKTRHAARWLLEREADQNALTKDAGRLLLGQDIGCAQCHDHPRVDDYTQRDYAGLQAFFNRTYLFRPDNKKPGLVAEQASGDLSYLSVFTKASGTTRPRLPGEAELAEPVSGEWVVAPDAKDKTVRPIPKHSRRALLAETIGTGNHPQFRRNIANRLWAVMFGRGLVEPLDMDHSANPASHPELMNLLAAEIAAMKFDLKAFIRELALTRAFQRSLDLPATAGDAATLARLLPELEKTADVLDKAATSVVETFRAAQKEVVDASIAAAPFSAEWVKADADVAAAKKAADEAAVPLKAAEEKAAPLREAHQALVAAAVGVAEAIAKSGETPELLAATRTFQAKTAAAAKPLQAAEADVAAKRTAAEAKAKILADAQAKAAAAKSKQTEVDKVVAAKQVILDEASKRKEAARIQALHLRRLATDAKAALAWHTASAGIEVARKAVETAGQSVAAAKTKAGQIQATLASGPAQLAALESAHTAAQAEATKALEAATAKTPASAALMEAAEKVAAAAAMFPHDDELKQAAALVKGRSDIVTSEAEAAMKVAAGMQAKVAEAAKRLADTRSALEKTKADLAATQAQLPGLEAAATAARARVAAAESAAAEAREALSAAWGRSFASMDLLPLSPEQLCWSIMQATGQIEPLRAAATREWVAKNKFTEADEANPAKVKERDAGAEALYREKLRAQEAQFVRFFGGAAGQPQTDFFATPEQALYFENGGVVRNWASTFWATAPPPCPNRRPWPRSFTFPP